MLCNFFCRLCSFFQVPDNFFQVLSAENYKAGSLLQKVKNVKVQGGIPVENLPRGKPREGIVAHRPCTHYGKRRSATGTAPPRPARAAENENPPLQNPQPPHPNTAAAAPRCQKCRKKVGKGFVLQKPLRNFAQKIR